MDRKELFREWLKNNGMSASVQSNYPLYIDEYIPAILKGINLEVNSLFEITDLKKLEDILNKIQIDLKEINLEKSSFPSASLKKYIEYIKSSYKISKDEKYNMKTKNIMLYGAPGVGKTHNYKRLITMIEDGNNEKTIFDTISKNETTNDFDNSIFEDIKKEKRIEFVTFHQSYSYEDFIEGFRPSENSHIELEDGIFKLLCNKAKNQIKETIYQHISFDEAFDILRTQYIENELDKIFSVSNVEILIHEFKDKTIKVQSSNAKDTQYVKKSDLETVVQAILNNEVQKPSDIKNLDVKKDTISLGGLYYPIGKKIVEIINENKKGIEEKEKNFYIVIDEINRGNISKIFGELITLIEEDKRDTYEVTLPYSKEKFQIPSNLYIIATMNSTDKSIATIDIALRRRFTFLKMKPNLNLVPEIAKELFEKINEHISKTINEDYKLGHSYFMKIENENDLEFVKKYKIQSLLEEYFYGDEENYKKAISILNIKEDNQ
ncbi:type IV methyl-directed restriction system, component McrB [Arcobacter venerupis]|uniref:Type IV methyl-directed restriction system, component McrB n=1 Tax=Arcobacter venerupis TaxID=1054033 RepID=A0AAE7E3Y3_9BACT|nr:AAA family ATPase [Arcobacter venerupis]QKF66864.1 type IV methyl-directed restriction system, component McrB [Arcobacter venerupis]RWS49858.1 hypothetical protein CKA56_07155 [Arcobacter venerupis]